MKVTKRKVAFFYAHQRMVEIIITFYQNDESFQHTQRKLSTNQTKALDGSRNKFKIFSFEVLDFIIIFVAYSKQPMQKTHNVIPNENTAIENKTTNQNNISLKTL